MSDLKRLNLFSTNAATESTASESGSASGSDDITKKLSEHIGFDAAVDDIYRTFAGEPNMIPPEWYALIPVLPEEIAKDFSAAIIKSKNSRLPADHEHATGMFHYFDNLYGSGVEKRKPQEFNINDTVYFLPGPGMESAVPSAASWDEKQQKYRMSMWEFMKEYAQHVRFDANCQPILNNSILISRQVI